MFVKNGLFANLHVRKCVNQVCSREKEGHASGGLPKTDNPMNTPGVNLLRPLKGLGKSSTPGVNLLQAG